MDNREHEFNAVRELVLTFSSRPPPPNSHHLNWIRFGALSLHWSSCRHLFFCMHFNGGVIWREKEVHAVASVEWESSKTASMEKVGIRRWWPGREGENELSHSIELVLSILHWSAFGVFSPPLKHNIISLYPTCEEAFVNPIDNIAIDFCEMMKKSNITFIKELLKVGDLDYLRKFMEWSKNQRNAPLSVSRSNILESNPSDILKQGLTRVRDAYRHAFKNTRVSNFFIKSLTIFLYKLL